MKTGDVKNIITIGASAGGIAAVSRLLATFNQELDAAVFIVIHTARNSMTEVILNALQKQTSLKCILPADQQLIENRTIYLAPADHHMILEKGVITITRGAYENHWRPSIDVLFRSAAATYDSCVTGVILTGLLDDGASGMHAIKRSGGVCIVQDPAEAEFPDMPNSVLHTTEVDYKVSIAEMGYILGDLFSRGPCEGNNVPADVKLEADIAKRMSSTVSDLIQLGDLTPLTCPDCGGVMIQVAQDTTLRYRCYTGHSFTAKVLEEQQLKGIEESLWVAIRVLEERRNLLVSLSRNEEQKGNPRSSSSKRERADSIQVHVERLKGMLMDMGETKD